MAVIACDLDGTIVDTFEALSRAYAHAGVKWQPNRPWNEWCSLDEHREKERVYPAFCAQYARITSFGLLMFRPEWLVLTGASIASVHAVIRATGLQIPNLRHSLNYQFKIEHLRGTTMPTANRGISLYFDDDVEFLAMVEKELPGCQTVHVRPR